MTRYAKPACVTARAVISCPFGCSLDDVIALGAFYCLDACCLLYKRELDTHAILCLIPRTTVTSLSVPTLQDASFMRQSRCSFLNAWENTQVARAMTSVFVWNTRWRHGRSIYSIWNLMIEWSLKYNFSPMFPNLFPFSDPNGKPGRNSTMVDIGGRLPYWPRYFPREKLYLKLESTPSVGKNIKPDKMGFWNRLFSAASETQKRHQELWWWDSDTILYVIHLTLCSDVVISPRLFTPAKFNLN